MKHIDGQPVHNAAMPVRLKITTEDIENGAPLNPNACAVALAAVRQLPGVTAAKAHLGCVYLRHGKEWRRYRTSPSIRTEIVAFDRGGKFWPGEFYLLPIPVGSLIRRIRGQAASPSTKRKSPSKRRPVHHTEGVRETAHKNEPPGPPKPNGKGR